MTGPATTGIFNAVRSSDKRLESWLREVPARLTVLMRDIQHVLRELGHMPGVIISADNQRRLQTVNQREDEAYHRWKAQHGDVRRAPDEVTGNGKSRTTSCNESRPHPSARSVDRWACRATVGPVR